jgi:type IV pilus assembly protein PilB
MAEKKPIINGANGGKVASVAPEKPLTEAERAQDTARRYRCEFVDLNDFQLQHELFKKVPVDLMFRYNFIPLEETRDGKLAIAIANPSQLMMIDEISLLLGKRIVTKVATLKQISDILKKTEQSQRVLEEASEGFALDVIREDEQTGEETISIDRLTQQGGDHSPIIRLVDTTIFTALQRRASDIHIETRDDSVAIKFRIDGVLSQAMPPIGKEHHSTIISRIKVMSESTFRAAFRRTAASASFNGRASTSAFRSCLQSTAKTPCPRADKESMSEKTTLTPDVVGLDPKTRASSGATSKSPTAWLVTGPITRKTTTPTPPSTTGDRRR